MAYLFNLWNAYQPDDYVFEFDVTSANLPKMKDGSAEFVRACLMTFGVDIEPRSWQVTPTRCYYLSDYIGPREAWEDRWYTAWRVRVALRDPQRRSELGLARLPETLDALDSTWRHDFRDPRHDTTALIISVHIGSSNQLNRIAKQILDGARRGEDLQTEPELSSRAYKGEVHQLRLLFKDISFPAWIENGDRIVDLCRTLGGMVNFRELSLPNGSS